MRFERFERKAAASEPEEGGGRCQQDDREEKEGCLHGFAGVCVGECGEDAQRGKEMGGEGPGHRGGGQQGTIDAGEGDEDEARSEEFVEAGTDAGGIGEPGGGDGVEQVDREGVAGEFRDRARGEEHPEGDDAGEGPFGGAAAFRDARGGLIALRGLIDGFRSDQRRGCLPRMTK